MAEIYWLQRIGGISELFVIGIIACLVLAAIAIGCIAALYDGFCDEEKKVIWCYTRRFALVFAFLIVGEVFIPSKKEMYEIYGLGTMIDYIKSNDKAKQLPDKVVDALTHYINSIEKKKQR